MKKMRQRRNQRAASPLPARSESFVKLTVGCSIGIDAGIRSYDLIETGLAHPRYLIQGFVYDTHDKPLITTNMRI